MARPTLAALKAAEWVINMENGPERTRLYNGHMVRRRPMYEDGYGGEDHSEADAWLIEQYDAIHQGRKRAA